MSHLAKGLLGTLKQDIGAPAHRVKRIWPSAPPSGSPRACREGKPASRSRAMSQGPGPREWVQGEALNPKAAQSDWELLGCWDYMSAAARHACVCQAGTRSKSVALVWV